MKTAFKITFFFLFAIIAINSHAQDFTNIKDQKPIKISGGFGLKGSYFGAINEDLKRDPYYYSVNANININVYGVLNIPVSFFKTKQDSKLNYPEFNNYGISPKYKGYTLHLGYRNIQFSQYTLSGLTFLGAGVEIKPQKSWIEFSGLYGQFQKPVEYVDIATYGNQPDLVYNKAAFDRRGYGGKLTIKKYSQVLDLILFRAKDFVNSIDTVPASEEINPAENLVLGINSQNKITKNISIKTEYAISAYTNNVMLPETDLISYTYANNLGQLFTPRVSSEFHSMINSNLMFQASTHTIGLNYKRVDPGYKTMGATYLTDDVEEITVNTSFGLFKRIINISGNIGIQHNNLDKKQASTMTRLIGSAGANFTITKNLNSSLNFSNYSANTIPIQINMLDSIKYMQVTKNLSFNSNYNFGSEGIKHGLNFMISYQTALTINKTLTDEQNTGNDVISSNLSYNLDIPDTDIRISSGINYSDFISDVSRSTSFGPSLGINKSIFNKKIRIGLNTVYVESYQDSKRESGIMNFSINTSYRINEHQSLSLSGRLLNRRIISSDINSQQYQINIDYKYRF